MRTPSNGLTKMTPARDTKHKVQKGTGCANSSKTARLFDFLTNLCYVSCLPLNRFKMMQQGPLTSSTTEKFILKTVTCSALFDLGPFKPEPRLARAILGAMAGRMSH